MLTGIVIYLSGIQKLAEARKERKSHNGLCFRALYQNVLSMKHFVMEPAWHATTSIFKTLQAE